MDDAGTLNGRILFNQSHNQMSEKSASVLRVPEEWQKGIFQQNLIRWYNNDTMSEVLGNENLHLDLSRGLGRRRRTLVRGTSLPCKINALFNDCLSGNSMYPMLVIFKGPLPMLPQWCMTYVTRPVTGTPSPWHVCLTQSKYQAGVGLRPEPNPSLRLFSNSEGQCFFFPVQPVPPVNFWVLPLVQKVLACSCRTFE